LGAAIAADDAVNRGCSPVNSDQFWRETRDAGTGALRAESRRPRRTPPAETDIGVRVPDVLWASPDFMSRHGTVSPLPGAPELCIEVLSPSNTEPEMQQKTAAYLAAGAVEVWLVKEDGTMEMRNERGRLAASSFGIALGAPPD
jgi:hypothetical protein